MRRPQSHHQLPNLAIFLIQTHPHTKKAGSIEVLSSASASGSGGRAASGCGGGAQAAAASSSMGIPYDPGNGNPSLRFLVWTTSSASCEVG